MSREDIIWSVVIISAVVLLSLSAKSEETYTSTAAGQPLAGAGTDPYDAGEYTLDALAVLGGV